MQLTKNFNKQEFACRCGCGLDGINLRLVESLQKFRDSLGKPIHILSGIRCKKHNKKVGGAVTSWHLVGRAADIHVLGMDVRVLHNAVLESRLFNGIGFYPRQNFVHVDNRMTAARWKG